MGGGANQMFGGQGGGSGQMMVMQGGGGQGGQMMTFGGGQAGGGQSGEGGQQRRMSFGMGGNSNMTPEQQQKMAEIMKKALNGKNMMELSQEERQAVFTKIRDEAKKAGIEMPQRGQRREGVQGGEAGAAGAAQSGPGGAQMAAGGQGRGQRGGNSSGNGGGMPGIGGATGPFSQKDLDNAQLPPPPSEGDQMEVLMRPGLLADVEIIVEKVPNAVFVPNQGVFEKDGKSIVYVQSGKTFQARNIAISKRSETVSVIASGLKPGDVIALQDPTVSEEDRKKKAEKKSSGGAASALPVGGSKGGQ
jgi:hypothetical protein